MAITEAAPTTARATPPPLVTTRRAIGALLALSLATFSYVTVEILPIGLLTLIGADLGVSLSSVGLLVTAYALIVVVTSVPLARVTRAVPRRTLLGVILVAFVLASAVSAIADSYPVLLAARIVIALTHAVFWAVVGPTAASLFPRDKQGRSMALLFAGSSTAPLLGVPAGTWLGQQAGWRAAFLAMTAIGLLTCAAVLALLPATAVEDAEAQFGDEPDRRRYLGLVATTALGTAGYFTTATYSTAFLLDVSGYPPSALSALLLVCGAAGLAGAVGSGFLADRRPDAALVAPLALMTFALLGLYVAGTAKVPAIALLALGGLGICAFATGLQSRVLQVAPGRTDMASAGMSSAFNAGIAVGAFLGGVLVSNVGLRSTALVGALLTAAALGAHVLARWPRNVPDRAAAAGSSGYVRG